MYWPQTRHTVVTFCRFRMVRVRADQLFGPLRTFSLPRTRTETTAALAGSTSTANPATVTTMATAGMTRNLRTARIMS